MYPTNPVDDHGSKWSMFNLLRFFRGVQKKKENLTMIWMGKIPPPVFSLGVFGERKEHLPLNGHDQGVGWAAPPCSSAIAT